MMMAIPLLGLYEISIGIAAIAGRRRDKEKAEDSDNGDDTLQE
jgi:Sec-independent protein secretion pathway component TatC